MEVRLGYKQTEVGVIPEDWEVKTLFELAERKKEFFDDGDWIESEHITTQGIRLIQTGNIGVGRFIEKDDKKYIYESSFTSLKCKLLEQGDLLVCRLADPAGRACVLTDIGEGRIVTSVDVTIFRPPSELADRLFLVQIFSTSDWFKAVSGRSGGTTHKRISRGALGRLSIGLPPLPEQRAIATALSDVDALLGGLERLIVKKRDLKQAAMQQLLTGQTRLPGFHGEWEVKRLGDVVEIVMGQSPSSSNYNTKGAGLPLIQGNADINNRETIKRIFTTQITKRGKSGDILMSVRAPVGEISRAIFDVCLGRGVCAIRFDNDFMYHCLIYLEPTWAKHSKGSTFDSVNSADVKALEVNLPTDTSEQTAIAAVLTDMDAELAALTQRLAKTRALKQGMMQELLTGRTRLVVAEVAA